MARKKGRQKRRQLAIWEGVGATYAPRGLSAIGSGWYDNDLDEDDLYRPYEPFDYEKWRSTRTDDWDFWLTRPRPKKPDFDFITPSLATGGLIKDAEEAALIKAAGITHIVNTSSELTTEGRLFTDLGIEYLYNPTADNYQWKDPEWFAKTIAFAVPAIRDGGIVYAHCLEGVNRGPSSAYAILRALGHDGDAAFDLIKTARPRAKVFYANDADRAIEEITS